MDNQMLVVVVLGLFGLSGLAVIAYINRTRRGELGELTRLAQSLTTQMLEHADVKLAPYGERLKPANEALSFLKQQVDEPTDWLIKQLAERTGTPADDIIAVLATPLQHAMNLTDGVPATPPKAPEQAEPGGTTK